MNKNGIKKDLPNNVNLDKINILYKNLFENTKDGIGFFNIDGTLILVNKIGLRFLKDFTEDYVGKHFSDIFPRKIGQILDKRFQMLIKNPKIYESEEYAIFPSKNYWFLTTFAPVYYDDQKLIGIQVIVKNITEKKRIEDALRHAQKMESLGRLAGSITHDFNNILMNIMGNSELIKESCPEEKIDVRKSANIIFEQAKKASYLTNQLLGLTKRDIFNPVPINLNQVITFYIPLLEKKIGDNIRLELELENKIWPINADISQIEQLIANLILNANDAMPKGGTIKLKTENYHHEKEEDLNFPTGKYVKIVISDSGKGIDEEEIPKIFDPFYSTKENGQGLGLAIVEAIILSHQATIAVESEKDKGTSFIIFFPTSSDKIIYYEEESPSDIKSELTIAVLDDDQSVTKTLGKILSKMGITVYTFNSPQDFINDYYDLYKILDLLIIDIIMPELSGDEIYKKIMKINNKAKIIFMSGYSKATIKTQYNFDHDINFIQKPFEVKEILSLVKKIISKKRETNIEIK